MAQQRFTVIAGHSGRELEEGLNNWVDENPGAKVRRTQLATATFTSAGIVVLYALVSFEPAEVG